MLERPKRVTSGGVLVCIVPLGGSLRAEEAARALVRRPGFAWLDGDGRPPFGAWSFVASDPVEQVTLRAGDRAPWQKLAAMEHGPGAFAAGPLGKLPRWIGWLGYDLAWVERPDGRHARPEGTPLGWFGRYEAVACFPMNGAPFVVADTRGAAARLLGRLRAERRRPRVRRRGWPALASPRIVPDAPAHRAAVEAVREAIAGGDVYQVNLARRWRLAFEGAPLDLYERLRRVGPVPLGALLHGPPGHWLLSRSMERFLRWDRGRRLLESRPIKGTAPWPGAGAVAARLRADPKERSEHAMIVDLVRNDLGRVARLGSVRVAELLRVEPYRHLAHLVSVVQAEAAEGLTLGALLRATFPPASVTGCPKEAAIDLIERLEPFPRGYYTGAIGFVDRAGGLSLSVAIRTARLEAGTLDYFAGGGIVYDSDPQREVAETELKARGFLEAVRRGMHRDAAART